MRFQTVGLNPSGVMLRIIMKKICDSKPLDVIANRSAARGCWSQSGRAWTGRRPGSCCPLGRDRISTSLRRPHRWLRIVLAWAWCCSGLPDSLRRFSKGNSPSFLPKKISTNFFFPLFLFFKALGTEYRGCPGLQPEVTRSPITATQPQKVQRSSKSPVIG